MSGYGLPWNQTASGSISATATLITLNPTAFGGYFIDNPNASAVYLQVFDAASVSAVTLGTTVPKLSFSIPANAAANLDSSRGIRFINGIVIAFTTTRTGNTSPASNCDYNIWFD